MNNLILIFTLIIAFVLLYKIHNKKFGPSNILVLSFGIPSVLIVIFSDYFSYEVSIETIVVINLLVGMFAIGEMTQSKRIVKGHASKMCYPNFVIGKRLYYVFLGIVLFNTYVQYKYLMQLGALKGASGLIEAYAASRLILVEYQNSGVIEVARSYSSILLSLVATIVEIVCVHVYVLNRVVKKYNDKRLLIVVIVYFISLFFSSGRYAFVPVIIHLAYLVIVFLEMKMQIGLILKRYRKKILAIALIGGAVFVALGMLRSGTDGNAEELDAKFTVTTYVAAPIIGLDIYIKNGMKRAPYIGSHAFRDYYDYARLFGASYKRIQFHKEDFHAGKGSSNVYSGFYYWLSDFGLLGASFYALFLGLIVGHYYFRKPNLYSISEIYLRSFLYYALVMMFYDDQFNNLFSLFMLVTIVALNYIQRRIVKK